MPTKDVFLNNNPEKDSFISPDSNNAGQLSPGNKLETQSNNKSGYDIGSKK